MLGIAPKVHLRLRGKADPHPASHANVHVKTTLSYSDFQGAIASIIGTVLPSVNLRCEVFAFHPVTTA